MNLINVLIVDDSPDFAKNLGRSLESKKTKVTICANAQEALGEVEHKKFNLCLIDCMLPGTNGVDLAKKIHASHPESVIILMSGIFKDAAFSAQMKSEKCVHDFFEKPLEVEDIKALIRKHWPGIALNEFSDNYPFLKNFTDTESVVVYLRNNLSVNSYCLPKILSILLQKNINGTLSFARDDIEIVVTISNKNITKVFSKDKTNTFGQVLIELGFIQKEDFDSFLNSDLSKNSKLPIGKQLEKYNLLSPHASILANQHQMKTRLTQLFEAGNFNISFKEHDVTLIDDSILTMKDIEKLTEQWVNKNISTVWLSEAFHTIKDEVPKLAQIEHKSMHLNRIRTGLKEQKNIENINTDIDKTELNRSLFYAFSLNLISLGNLPQEGTDEAITHLDQATLEKLHKSFSEKTFYEILNVKPDMNDKDIAKKYHSFAKDLHPDKLPPEASDELKSLCEIVFAQITEAFNNIKSQEARNKYENEQRQKNTNEFFENDSKVNEAKALLLQSKFKSAFEILNSDSLKKNPPSHYSTYLCWAHIKSQPASDEQNRVIETFLKDTAGDNQQVETQFVQSLIKLKQNDVEGFEKLIGNCLKKDPGFLPARRELSVLKSELKEKNAKSGGSKWSLFSKKAS